jgi:probable rRNA maturation factor
MAFRIKVFNSSGTRFLPKAKVEQAVRKALKSEGKSQAEINIVYLDDDEIHELNKKYLKHDYVTDVISFQLGEDKIEGEIYIGTGKAKEQAGEYKVSLTKELMRLAVHGVLHMIGFDDYTEENRKEMFYLETKYIED